METLIIDNYDSFTYNIYQLIAEINQNNPVVVSNNQLSWQEIKQANFDNIIISPGPGNPEKKEDFGVCEEVLLKSEIPILGICLGHQGLGYYYGEKIIKAPEPYHGRISQVYHSQDGLFFDIPSPFSVVRYHSLIITNNPEKFNSLLEVIAYTQDNIIMGIKHKYKPYWGVQFHPESICSDFGKQLLINFNNLTEKYYHDQQIKKSSYSPINFNRNRDSNIHVISKIIDYHVEEKVNILSDESPVNPPLIRQELSPLNPPLIRGGCEKQGVFFRSLNNDFVKDNKTKIFSYKLGFFLDSEIVFNYLYKDSQYSFWLDSSLVEEGLSRFSYMGDIQGENSFLLTYDVNNQIIIHIQQDNRKTIHGDIFTFLDEYLAENSFDCQELPFSFQGGFVGYFGYELKALCGYKNKHQSPYADAQFIWCDRILVFDHLTENIYLVYLGDINDNVKAEQWFKEIESKLLYLLKTNIKLTENNKVKENKDLSYQLSRDEKEYLDNINIALEKIVQGESYEVCLTNHLYIENKLNPLEYYYQLRKANPAPYSCFLKLDNLYIACSSPERFLHLEKNGNLESKPIKGTVKRGQTKAEDNQLKNQLKCSEKERAENLMIVDLLRNDLGKVCQIGSVHVPKLMAIESYSTVHQMVSTVKGKIREGIKATDCIKACFPGGSMTGAPKKRTLEIIDELETEARGIYSGCIGFLGVNGTMDLNIVIRTAIITPEKMAIGVGGAITYLSSPQAEFAETILKAKALLGMNNE